MTMKNKKRASLSNWPENIANNHQSARNPSLRCIRNHKTIHNTQQINKHALIQEITNTNNKNSRPNCTYATRQNNYISSLPECIYIERYRDRDACIYTTPPPIISSAPVEQHSSFIGQAQSPTHHLFAQTLLIVNCSKKQTQFSSSVMPEKHEINRVKNNNKKK